MKKLIFLLISFSFLFASVDLLKLGLQSYNKGQYKRAYYLWLKPAQNGNSGAQNNIGLLFLKGEGVQKDIKKALYWFEKSAKLGNTDAKTSIGYIYYNYKNQKSKAISIWKEAASEGNSKAKANLVNIGVSFTLKQISKVLTGAIPGFGGSHNNYRHSSPSSSKSTKNSNNNSWRCRYITNSDMREMCIAITKKDTTYCNSIYNSDRRRLCKARVSNGSCYYIGDKYMKALCSGNCSYLSLHSSDSKKIEDMAYMCKKNCYYIKDSNYRELCRAINK